MSNQLQYSNGSISLKKEKKRKKVNINELLEDYTLDYGIFSDLDDRLYKIKGKGDNLNQAEKILMILYAEYNSYRKVSEIVGISHNTVGKFLAIIRKKLC